MLPLYGLKGQLPDKSREYLLVSKDKSCNCGNTMVQHYKETVDLLDCYVYRIVDPVCCGAVKLQHNCCIPCNARAYNNGKFRRIGESPAFVCKGDRRTFLCHHIYSCGLFVNFTQKGVKQCLRHGHLYHDISSIEAYEASTLDVCSNCLHAECIPDRS